MADPITVVVVEDHAVIRASLCRLLDAEPDIRVVGNADTGTGGVQVAREAQPDVVLMDIQMPGEDGLQATRLISDDASLDSRVVVLTMHDVDQYVYQALRAGAVGFLLKDGDPDDLVRAIRTVRTGDALLAPKITRRLVQRYTQPLPSPVDSVLDAISEREREVWRLVARGLSNDEIASDLVVSTATVKTHVSRLLTKLDARDRTQLVILAYEWGVRDARPGMGDLTAGG